MNDYSHLDLLISDLVSANSILASFGVLDAFGHVSVRHPSEPDKFLLSWSLAPELISAEDVMVFGTDCIPSNGDSRVPYVERFIHGEIYRARPDVMAVVHSHAPNVIAYTVSSMKLRAMYHMSAFLGEGVPVWDIADDSGITDMLVRTPVQGKSLATSLAVAPVVLMRGHGFVTVADRLATAVSRAIYTNLNAALQTQAISLGGTIKYLSAEEAAMATGMLASTIERPWNLWKKSISPGSPA